MSKVHEFRARNGAVIGVGFLPLRKSVCLYVIPAGNPGLMRTVAYFRNEAEAEEFKDALAGLMGLGAGWRDRIKESDDAAPRG